MLLMDLSLQVGNLILFVFDNFLKLGDLVFQTPHFAIIFSVKGTWRGLEVLLKVDRISSLLEFGQPVAREVSN